MLTVVLGSQNADAPQNAVLTQIPVGTDLDYRRDVPLEIEKMDSVRYWFLTKNGPCRSPNIENFRTFLQRSAKMTKSWPNKNKQSGNIWWKNWNHWRKTSKAGFIWNLAENLEKGRGGHGPSLFYQEKLFWKLYYVNYFKTDSKWVLK